MKKTKYLVILLAISILIIGLKLFLPEFKNVDNQGIKIDEREIEASKIIDTNTDPSIKDSVPPNWQTYNNSKLGVIFKYPDTWTKIGEESNAINRNGEVMSISISLIDTISNSNFYLAYHLAPYGAEVYKLAEDDYNSSKNSNEKDAKQIIVSGNKAFETFTTMSKDIKGNIYDPPLKLIHIVFLDKQKTGGYNLNFRTPAPDSEKEIAKFNQLLSTFKFINKPTFKTN